LSEPAVPSPSYLPRIVDAEVEELLTALRVVAIEGAKAVGKTATASRYARTIYRLDEPEALAVARAEPRRLLEGETPVLIDEWHRLPESWDLARRAADDRDVRPGSYLLTGSALPPSGARAHSGAGRIPTLRMRPLSLYERGVAAPTVSVAALLRREAAQLEGRTEVRLSDYVDEILASGFPGLRGLTGRPLRAQLEGYVSRIVDKDFEEVGHKVRNPAALRRWMTAYAAASSSTTTFERIRDAATGGEGMKPSRRATIPYRDTLERLWVVEPVEPWLPSKNYFSRLSQAPKHQLVDPALAAHLLGANRQTLLAGKSAGPEIARDGTLLGALFESLVTLNLRVYAQAAEAKVKHLRTPSGDHEVDLVVEPHEGDGVLAVEVKLASTIEERDDAVRHLLWLRERLGDDLIDAIVITTGTAAYRRPDGIGVVPASLLGP
jgi:hypothetical protein